MAVKRGKAKRARRGLKEPRPVFVQDCTDSKDHEGHRWRFSEKWPEGIYWWCRGYTRAEAQEGLRFTNRALLIHSKRDKPSRARARRARKTAF